MALTMLNFNPFSQQWEEPLVSQKWYSIILKGANLDNNQDVYGVAYVAGWDLEDVAQREVLEKDWTQEEVIWEHLSSHIINIMAISIELCD